MNPTESKDFFLKRKRSRICVKHTPNGGLPIQNTELLKLNMTDISIGKMSKDLKRNSTNKDI